jgi:hypothetical protein
MASLFDTLQAQAFRAGVSGRTKESIQWFQDKVQGLNRPSVASLMSDDALDPQGTSVIGEMYMYMYDPKLKKTLPYYDRFPLTIMVDEAPGGFYGINLHYLPPEIRAIFLDKLLSLGPKNPKPNSRLTKMRYDLLKGSSKYREFKPCFKHYLAKHVKSKFVRVPITEWEIATFLPVEQFRKANKNTVWAESKKII